jgi:hypothetical protein
MTFAFLLSFVPIVGIGLYAILQRRSSKPRREPVYRTQRVYHIDVMVGGGTSRKLETVGGLFTTTLQDISTKIKQMQRRSVKNTPLSDHATKK